MSARCEFCGGVNDRGGRFCSVKCKQDFDKHTTRIRREAHAWLLAEGWAISTIGGDGVIEATAYHLSIDFGVDVSGKSLPIAMELLWKATRKHAAQLKASGTSS